MGLCYLSLLEGRVVRTAVLCDSLGDSYRNFYDVPYGMVLVLIPTRGIRSDGVVDLVA